MLRFLEARHHCFLISAFSLAHPQGSDPFARLPAPTFRDNNRERAAVVAEFVVIHAEHQAARRGHHQWLRLHADAERRAVADPPDQGADGHGRIGIIGAAFGRVSIRARCLPEARSELDLSARVESDPVTRGDDDAGVIPREPGVDADRCTACRLRLGGARGDRNVEHGPRNLCIAGNETLRTTPAGA